MNWTIVELGDLAEFRNGINYNKNNFGSGIKVIGVADFQNYIKPRYKELEEVNPEGVVKDEDILQNNDILFVRSNGNKNLIGRSLFIESPPEPVTFSGFCIRTRFTSSQAFPRFFAYLFRSDLIRKTLSAYGGGTNIANLNQKILSRLKVPLPSLSTQQQIAEILSAYDNAIANNNQRIALLEESIHQLYKEWFVRLRFPGYESVKVVDGVPEGWNKVSVTQIIDFKPKTLAPKKELRPYVPMEAVSTNSMILTGIQTRPVGGGAKFKNGDTLLARITPCLENGKTAFVQFMDDDDMVATGSTEFIVMRSMKVTAHWVYCLARSYNFRQHAINSMAGSDGRQRVKPDCFEQYQVFFPPPNILKYFNNVSTPIFKQIKYLNSQNQKLKEARDLLLPRLMNEKITV